MSSQFNGQNLAAYGRWAGADVSNNKGGKVANTGAGTYTITLEQGLGANECIVLVCPEANVYPKYAHTSNTVKTVTLADTTNAATNANFSWAVFQLPQT